MALAQPCRCCSRRHKTAATLQQHLIAGRCTRPLEYLPTNVHTVCLLMLCCLTGISQMLEVVGHLYVRASLHSKAAASLSLAKDVLKLLRRQEETKIFYSDNSYAQ
jgi:hypothetical protein